jgi:hypothetical protein
MLTNVITVKHLPSWLPGLGFMERVAVGKQLSKLVWERPFEETKSAVVRDSNISLLVLCFTSVISRVPAPRHNRWWLIF